MATTRGNRSNIRAGIAVLASITAMALAIWGWNALQDTRRMKYVFWFRASEGVYGLRVGSPVTIGGVKHGEVTEISPPQLNEPEEGAARGNPGADAHSSPHHFRVEIAIDPEVRLYSGAKFHAVPAGVGGDSIIEIFSVGRPSSAFPGGAGNGAQAMGGRLEAQPSNPFRQWFGVRSGAKVKALVAAWFPEGDGDSLRKRLEAIVSPPDDAPPDPDTFSNVRTRAEDTWKFVKSDFDAWEKAYGDAKASIDAGLERLGDADHPADGTLRASWAAIKKSWEEWPEMPPGRVDAVERRFGDATSAAARAGAQVDALAKDGSFLVRDLGETGAQGSLTLQEFRAAKIDAILSPWRIFERPDAAYLAADHRREAARLYAEAATEHRWVLKSIEATLRRDSDLLKDDPQLAELLRARFEAASAAFEERRRLAEELILGPERPAEPK